MKGFSKGLMVGVILLVIFGAVSAFALQNLTIASGKAGGTWYPLGGAIAEIIQSSMKDVNMAVMQGTGDANIIGVNSGMYTMGLSFSISCADAILGQAQFKQPLANLAGMASLYASPLQIVVRGDSKIKTVADLKGKRIAPGLKGTASEVLMVNILKVYGLSYADMAKVEHLSYADAAMQMKDGHIDAFTPFTTVPAPSIQDIAVSVGGGVRLLSVPPDKLAELKKINPGYSEFLIPAGSYKGQDAVVMSIGSNNVIACQKNLPEKLVYDMTKALVDNKARITAVHQVLQTWTPEYAARDLGIPLHPGALKLYKEIGAVK